MQTLETFEPPATADHLSEADITAAIELFFLTKKGVPAHLLDVAAHEDIVRLTGITDNLLASERAKQSAVQAGRRVVGVWDVHNLLTVRTRRLTPDVEVRQAILDALARDPYVRIFEFRVRLTNGRAHLYALVNSHFEQAQAAEVASGVSDVAEVENGVRVLSRTGPAGCYPYPGARCPAPYPNADFALAERTRRLHCWSASLYNQNVTVLVENGRATLTGTVATWLDREQAAFDAYEAGAQRVDNDLLLSAANGL